MKGVIARGQTCSREGRSNVDHILTLRILIKQEVFVDCCLYSSFVDFKKEEAFDIAPWDKLWEGLQHLVVPLHLQQVEKMMYTTTLAKIQIEGDTHGEIMSNIGVKKKSPFSHIVWLIH